MILPNHYQEWLDSAVDPGIIELNVRSLSGNQPYEYLVYSDDIPRRNDGRLTDHWLKKYRHTEQGGWWCSGVDILTGEDDLWGCFKPRHPRWSDDGTKQSIERLCKSALSFSPGRSDNGKKLIKYEHPPKTATGIFALKVPLHIWQRIAERYRVPMPLGLELYTTTGMYNLFWEWVIAHPKIPVVVTEGAKKVGALLTAGYCAIALPGVNGGYRVPKDEFGNKIGRPCLIPQLLKLAAIGRPLYLAFDQDSKLETIQRVRGAIGKTGVLLAQQGCKVKVISWRPELGKGVDDLIFAHGSEAFDAAYEAASALDNWRAKGYTQLSYTPNIRVNRRYLGAIQIPTGAKLIALKSAKGTGKTEALAEVVQEAIYRGQRVLVITHRVQLGEALCHRFGIDYVTEFRTSETKGVFGYGLCIDSLHPNSQAKFNPSDWQDALVIIDECEQVLWHLLNSSTCASDRVPILKSFKTLIQNTLSGNGWVIASDADLSDVSLNYLIALSGVTVEPFVVVNDWKPGDAERWRITSYQDTTPAGLVNDLVKHIADGGKPFVCVSAQKPKSKWGTVTQERYLKKRFPELRILRIDSESVADPGHPAYGAIANLNDILALYDIVIASPSIETGVSIDIRGHFTSVWGIAQGVQAENSVRQSLARIRENVPRYLWAAAYGIGKIGNGSTNINDLLACEHQKTKANIRQLTLAGFDELSEDADTFQNESLTCFAKMAVRHNASMINYRNSILEALRDEGHLIVFAALTDEEESDAIVEDIKLTRDIGYQEYREAVAASSGCESEAEYKELQDKRSKTEAERLKVNKHSLGLRYGVEVTPDLVARDDDGWYPQLRLHYFLTIGRDYLAARDKANAKAQVERGEGDVFKPDFNRSQLGLGVKCFDVLGVTAILQNQDRELKNTDPDLMAFASKAKANSWQIKAVTGIGISQSDTPIAIIKRFADKAGHSLEYLRKETVEVNGSRQRVRVYRITTPQDGRDEVFAVWLARDEAKAAETEAQPTTVTPVHSLEQSPCPRTVIINDLSNRVDTPLNSPEPIREVPATSVADVATVATVANCHTEESAAGNNWHKSRGQKQHPPSQSGL
ncbi:plasmid replication protein, CyRepA1 family [Allocoleopsis franciscana]|uniref:DUF3854 domain-containing protein n=1 Tax=Allocoleopsis franciscana PCC 7113 TaxID=1173027 RepID=K9WPD4_9CYAN|nr:plasmid replication protein, CyRepA1 family [Allocoleopsis franciscana]AFZ22255.1 hypothetical protein Mic7113_6691 [Allocoleopsis franciscana PCC 7113]